MSAFDVQVRKVDNDWVKRVPWQNGTDGALLREVFDIHQKWGLSNLIPAFAAVKHVFGQDAPKAATVEVALEKVQELRKIAEKAESAQQEQKDNPGDEGKEITREMVFAKVKEQQQAKLQSAQSAVASLESELNLKRDERTSAEDKQDLLRARTERDRIASKISAGQAEFGEADMDEAMSALL